MESINTSMKRAVKGLLVRSFVKKELDTDYFRNCTGYVISDKQNVYEIEANDDLDFTIASLAFVKDSTICIFATEPSFRNKGYGGMLLESLIDVYGELNLCVRVSNENAIKLYKSKGFVITETLPNFYNYTGINEDGYRMVCKKYIEDENCVTL